ncbi:MAG: S8 family serine peptidase [Firmicutes bacterium]|nr:S8 family serine peptidase [Bacillota bacterium]
MCRKKIISLMLVLLMPLSFICSGFAYARPSAEAGQLLIKQGGITADIDATPDGGGGYDAPYADDEILDVIVTIDGETLLDSYIRHKGRFRDSSRFLNSKEGADAIDTVNINLNAVKRQIQKVAPSVQFGYEYNVGFMGFSLKATYLDIKKIATLKAVTSIEINAAHELPAPEETEAQFAALEAQIYGGGEYGISAYLPDSTISLTTYGMYDTAALEYKGEGMLIAVLDSGINLNHTAFSVMPKNPKYPDASYLTTTIMSSLKARGILSSLTAAQLFKSQKIPFGFDYANRRADPTAGTVSGISDHGIHVSGIACGNNGGSFKGTAPEAQLAAFKIMASNSQYFYDSESLAAIEDAWVIGADCVNMSVGSVAGTAGEPRYEAMFQKYVEAGITVVIAAGNDYNAGATGSGTTTIYADNPDFSVIGSPSTYRNALSVANFNKAANAYTSSSWGTNPDLRLTPEISSAGESIYSAAGLPSGNNNNTYQNKWGTSMSSPNVAGAIAIVKQMIKEEYPTLKDDELDAFAKQLVMSTAFPMRTSGGLPFSPRIQGAGFLDLENALNAKTYLYVKGTNTAKYELFDDPDKIGVYDIEFVIKNLTESDRRYSLRTETQTHALSADYRQLLLNPHKLNPLLEYSALGEPIQDASVTVAGGAEVTVNAKITLFPSDIEHLNRFPNGTFVEGFVFLTPDKGFNGDAAGSNLKLNMPFMGFYGDWTQIPVFDATVYEDRPQQYSVVSGQTAKTQGLYMRTGTSSSTDTLMGAYEANDIAPGYLDTLPIEQRASIKPKAEYIAMNYRSSGNLSMSLYQFRIAQTRNTVNIRCSILDPVTETVFVSGSIPESRKSLMSESAANRQRYLNLNFTPFSILSNDARLNNVVYEVKIEAMVEYKIHDGEYHQALIFPVFMDAESPMVLDAQRVENGASTFLDVTTFDNHYVRVIKPFVMTKGARVGLNNGYGIPVAAENYGETATTRINITNYLDAISGSDDGLLHLDVEDFARNRKSVTVGNLLGGGGAVSALLCGGDGQALAYGAKANVAESYQARGGTPVLSLDDDPATYRTLDSGRYELLNYTDSPARTVYTVREGTVRIAPNAFLNAVSLKSVILPKELLRIGHGAFFGCENLTDYVFQSPAAPLLEIPYSIMSDDAHPYNHFGAGIADAGAQNLTLFTTHGVKAYGGFVYDTYFANKAAASVITLIDQNGEFQFPPVVQEIGTQLILPRPAVYGYEVEYWCEDEDLTVKFTSAVMPQYSLVLYAKWMPATFTISFDTAGGGDVDEIRARYETVVQQPLIPVKTGYTFKYWYRNDPAEAYVFNDMPGENITLTALWEINRYSLTFNSMGGSEIPKITFEYGTQAALPGDPDREGYVFKGWYKNEGLTEAFDGNTTAIDFETILYAKWENLNTAREGCACGSVGGADAGPLFMLIFAFLAASLVAISPRTLFRKRKKDTV